MLTRSSWCKVLKLKSEIKSQSCRDFTSSLKLLGFLCRRFFHTRETECVPVLEVSGQGISLMLKEWWQCGREPLGLVTGQLACETICRAVADRLGSHRYDRIS